MSAKTENAFRVARNSAYSKTLVIDLVPSALSADSTNWVVAIDAAADTIVQDLVYPASNNAKTSCVLLKTSRASAGSSLRIISRISLTLSANIVYPEEFGSTVAVSCHDVE